ncbi:MAG: flagellar hook assembly protein FlgD [Pseudodonghicola sp.]
MDVTGTTGTTTTSAASSNSLSQLGEDYTRFLTLLTAQIQNQDPLAPMDSTQFVSQLAQLSQVEQSVKTNTNLETLSSQFSALAATSGAQMIGRDVTVFSSMAVLEDGASDAYYMLPDGAAKASVEIYDPMDRLVRTISGLPVEAGELTSIGWDGTDDAGEAVLDGNYTVKIAAEDADGVAVPAYTYRKTSVGEVLFADGDLYYKLKGDETVASDLVLAIR